MEDIVELNVKKMAKSVKVKERYRIWKVWNEWKIPYRM